MFYPSQFVTEQIQQEEQQRRELQQLLHQQSLLLSTPPLSPMSATLGHPNRSCASCKKRKVKCDRKTPSCTACQKSKHRCQYTSYSPPTALTDEHQQQNEDENIRAIKRRIEELDSITKQRWEQFQKMMAAAVTKNERDLSYANPGYYNNMEEEEVVFFNPAIPTSTGATHYALQQQNSPQQLQQLQIPQQQPTVSYLLSPPQQYQSSAETSPYIQTQNLVIPPGSYAPYMSGTIVLNYNVNAMRSFLGRQVAPLIQSVTGGQGPSIPQTGFANITQLQDWLREKFLCQGQDWAEELESYGDFDERIELRPIFEEVNNQQFSLRQKFEVILHRAEFSSSPSSVHGDSFHYDFEEKNHMEMENLTSYSETGSNRSSIIDIDSSDVFLNKIYAFVRRFIRNHPWLRENFLASLRERSQLSPLETYDGVFSDVVVEVRKVPSYNAFQDLKLIQNPQDAVTKGRLSLF